MARDSSAYKFSLFDRYDGDSAAPEILPELEPFEEPVRRYRPKTEDKPSEKRSARTSSRTGKKLSANQNLNAVKVFIAVAFIFVMMCIPMYLNVKLDETAKNISSVQSQIDIAKSENVRLCSALEGMVSIDKIEKYAENNLGMVKLENYKITYFNSDAGNHVVISGGKSYRNTDSDKND